MKDWPATKPKLLPLHEIIPYDKNPRTHPPEQIVLLAQLMQRHGVDQPIVVDEHNVILKGHGRRLAAERAGFETFPVVVHRGLSDSEKIAMRMADNQVALLSGWDSKLLNTEITNLKAAGYEIPLLGFSEIQLRGWGIAIGNEGLQDPEIAPEPPKHPVVRTGDLWMLGDHRLLCGDATNADDVNELLNDDRPHLMVTDPPYGVDYDPSWRNRVKRQDGSLVGAKAVGEVVNDNRDDWREAWMRFDGKVAYVWHGGLHASVVQDSLIAVGLSVRSQIIWAKQQFVIGRGDYHWQHECCWYVVRKGSKGYWASDRKQTTIWSIAAPSGWMQIKEGADAHQGIHSTQKPIECMKRPIENNSKRGDFVYDPFVGSGTTIIAAEMTARKCLALEIDPAYVQVSIERWQNSSGKEALLGGKTFEAIKLKRKNS